MKKRTWDLIVLISTTILEIIKIIKEKMNGGRNNHDREGTSEKK